jgi:hypothetical protein
MVADDLGGERREQPGRLSSLAEGAFRIFHSGMDRLGRFKLFAALFAAVFVEGHVWISSSS